MAEVVPTTGNYTHVHRGVQPNMDAVSIGIYNGIFSQEGTNQAQYPGTAFVSAGGFSKKVADTGITRRVTIVNFNIQAFSQRKWKTWKGERHWDCTVVVSYDGFTMNIPQGATGGAAEPAVGNFPETALREQLRLRSGL